MRDLRGLVADPARGADATPEEAAAALVELGVLVGVLVSRTRAIPPADKPDSRAVGDRTLTADEAAELLGVKPRWLRGRRLPFRVRLSERRVRYSEAGLLRYLQTNRPSRSP